MKKLGDKVKHFIFGFLAGAIVRVIVTPFAGWDATHGVGFGAGLALGLLKEAYDTVQNNRAEDRGEPPPHSVEAADVIATTLGGAVGEAAVALVRFVAMGGV